MTLFQRDQLDTSLADVREAQGVTDLLEDSSERLLIALTHALHRFGLPGHRLEATHHDVSTALGVSAQVIAMPTSLLFAFGDAGDQRVALLRVQPSSIDLGRLADLDALTRQIIAGMPRADARRALAAILDAPRRWPWPVDLLSGALASGTAAALFPGAGLPDMLAAAVIGAGVAALAVASERVHALSETWMVLSALGSAAFASWASRWDPTLHPGLVTVSGIILLVPGLSFTIGMMELATRNLSSAVARFAAVGLTLVQLGLGIAIAHHVVPPVPDTSPATLPVWALPAALLVLPPAIGQLMGCRARDLPVIVVASGFGWIAARTGATVLGPIAGAAVGTFALGLTANVYSRVLDRPAIIPMVTGLFLLVPGSLGFLGIEALLSGDTLAGIEALFRMGMGAFALAAGLVVSTAVLHPRRAP